MTKYNIDGPDVLKIIVELRLIVILEIHYLVLKLIRFFFFLLFLREVHPRTVSKIQFQLSLIKNFGNFSRPFTKKLSNILPSFIFTADPLVGSIASQYTQNREEHDRIAR